MHIIHRYRTTWKRNCKKKHLRFAPKRLLFHHKNVPACSTAFVETTLMKLELLDRHPLLPRFGSLGLLARYLILNMIKRFEAKDFVFFFKPNCFIWKVWINSNNIIGLTRELFFHFELISYFLINDYFRYIEALRNWHLLIFR